MLNLIGLGLYDEWDLSLKAVDAMRKSKRVYLESYTSYYNGSQEALDIICGQKVTKLTRADVEEHPEKTILNPKDLKAGDVSLLVFGDPLVATTHSDLYLRAKKAGIPVTVIHNSSIYSAIGETGLQLYKFGRTITIAYPEGKYFPMSPYDGLAENLKSHLHTLCLLDVKAAVGRYMSVNEGIHLLSKMEDEKRLGHFTPKTMCVGVARLGGDATIRYATAEELLKIDFGGPPHALIVPGKLHFLEEDMLKTYSMR